MRIALDAMGSDNCPVPDVQGAVLAAQESDGTIVLVGQEDKINQELAKYNTTGLNLEVVHAPEVITMHDKPSNVGKLKPQSSMHVGMNLVKDGKADAFVTMGNTGAAQAIAMLFTLRRIPGIKRPALSAIFRIQNRPIIFLDIGANADCRADWMLQFAAMGAVYAQNALKLNNPRVGLLSNGEEEGKGTELVKATASLLHASPLNFIGNIQPTDLFQAPADVIVSDGFSGNILMKTFEGATRYLVGLIREEIKSSPVSMVGGLLVKPAMNRVRQRIDTGEIGGAPLLGVNGVVMIGHGSSNGIAVKNAIHQARRAAEGKIIHAIETMLATLPKATEGNE